MHSPRRTLALAGIVGLAAMLRFTQLDRQGLLFFDEGQLILEAREAVSLMRHGLGTLVGTPDAPEALAAAIKGCTITFARPVHNAALAAVLIVAPRARADQATFWVSAATGTATVALVWWLGRLWFGAAVGLLAALFLAISPYHVLYSREGLSDALAVCWWVLALGCAERAGSAMAFWSGLAGGLCFGTNFRTLFLPLVLLPLVVRQGGIRSSLTWFAGFFLPLLACEGFYHVAAGLARLPASAFSTGTYAGQFKTLILLHGGQEFLLKGFGAFPYYVWRWEGAGALALLLAAAVMQVTRWRGPDAALNLAWLTPWILFSAYWDNASRFFVLLMPLVAIMKARWILEAAARLPRPRRMAAVLGLGAVAITVPALFPLIPRPTPYLAAAEFLSRAGNPRHFSTNSRLGLAYFGPGGSAPIPPTVDQVRNAPRAGWRWAVTDLQVLFGGFDRPEDRFATSLWIGRHRRSVLTVPYNGLALAQAVLEQDLTFAEARARLTELEAMGPRLHVFDLSLR